MGLRVWIDQDLCTGDGICAEICPPLFFGFDDGLFYVKEEDDPTGLGPDGQPKLQMGVGTAAVPDRLAEAAIEAAEDCPGECIFFDVD